MMRYDMMITTLSHTNHTLQLCFLSLSLSLSVSLLANDSETIQSRMRMRSSKKRKGLYALRRRHADCATKAEKRNEFKVTP